MPETSPCGRPPGWTTRELLNAIFYVLRGGGSRRTCRHVRPRSATSTAGVTRACLPASTVSSSWTTASRSVGRLHRQRRCLIASAWIPPRAVGHAATMPARRPGQQASGARRYGRAHPRSRSVGGQRSGPGGVGPVLRLSRRTFPSIAEAFADAWAIVSIPTLAIIFVALGSDLLRGDDV